MASNYPSWKVITHDLENDENNNPPSVINDPNAKDVEFRLSTDIGSGKQVPPDISQLTGELTKANGFQSNHLTYLQPDWHPGNFIFWNQGSQELWDYSGKISCICLMIWGHLGVIVWKL